MSGKKKIKVFEAFAGIGAQHSALKRLNIDYEIVGISEWFINALLTYDAIHSENNEEIEIPSYDEQIKYLNKYTFSKDSVNPVKDITKLSRNEVENLYIANKRTKNYGSITEIKGNKLPKIDLLVYSFPCQDLSTGGKTLGMSIYEAKSQDLIPNYKKIWTQQSCLESYKVDLAKIAKLVYDVFNDPNRQILNIGEYAKREICWNKLNEHKYSLSSFTISQLITKEDAETDNIAARRDQKLSNEVDSEIAIFNLGIPYWERVLEVGHQLNELSGYEENLCDIAIKYIQQKYQMLSKKQAKEIWTLKLKMDKYLGE